MTIDRYLRQIAGFFVMLTVALGYWVHPAWFLFTAFVGLNLFQSSFTNWCPMMMFLRKMGVKAEGFSSSSCSQRLLRTGGATALDFDFRKRNLIRRCRRVAIDELSVARPVLAFRLSMYVRVCHEVPAYARVAQEPDQIRQPSGRTHRSQIAIEGLMSSRLPSDRRGQ